MKVTDKGNFHQIELETPTGQANYLSSLKAAIPGDRRTWQRDPETQEMNQYIATTNSQFVVKVGEVFSKI